MKALLSVGHCRNDFDFHEKFWPRQTLNLDERGGRVIALVKITAYRGAVLAPRRNVEYPGSLFHGIGWRGPGSPQDVSNVGIHLLGLATPVPHPGDRTVG